MFKNVVVAVDLDHADQAKHILHTAATIVAGQNAKIHLLNVVPAAAVVVSQYLPESYEQMAGHSVEKELADIAASSGFDEGSVDVTVRFGVIYREILALAEKTNADLIVTGSHEPGVADYLIGSNSARVMRHAPCSVFVVRSE